MQKKTAIITISTLWGVILLLLGLLIPLWIKRVQVQSLKRDISKIEKEIDKNKANWKKCASNMQTWNTDNDKNREMLRQLQEQYNEMVGFTSAWHDE